MTGNRASWQHNGPPGERLKKAREHYGWSVHEIAERLHIIPRYVLAIENADYSQLPGLVFLKGYTRSYARLVGVAEDQVIEQLEQDLALKDDPLLTQAAASAGPFTELELKSRKPLWYALIVIMAIVAGSLAWFAYQTMFGIASPATSIQPDSGEGLMSNKAMTDEDVEKTENQVGAEDVGEAPDTSAVSAELASSRDANTDEIELTIGPSAALPGAAATAPTAGGVVETTRLMLTPQGYQPAENRGSSTARAEIGAGVAGDSAAGQTITQDSRQQNETGQNPQSAPAGLLPANRGDDTALRDTAQQTAGSPGEVSAEGSVTVEAVFTGDCWFDLRDKDNDRIVGLYRSGDRVDFSGQYPLKFIVGAVDSVIIRVDDNTLNLNDFFVKNNRAQFTLDQ